MSSVPSRVLRHSKRTDRNQFGQFGFGGNNRTRQVEELLLEAGLRISDYSLDGMFSRSERLRAARFMYASPLWRPKGGPRAISRLAGEFCSHVAAFAREGETGVVLTEEPTDFVWHLAARKARWHSIVTPHCLESLWPDWINPITGSTVPRSLHEELRFLASASEVFFISREEQWLAANYGVPGRYLPYFPPSDVRTQLGADRRRVEQTRREGREYLIFGAAVQPNTVNGLKLQAKLLVDILGDQSDILVHVVGVGTEGMRETWSHPLFQFHGPVSDEELQRIKARVRACLIYAPRGHGALTRIPEMLLSGVSVIADAMSCRSAWTYVGLHAFDDPRELANLLRADLPRPPPPERPVSFEREFIEVVRALLAEGPRETTDMPR